MSPEVSNANPHARLTSIFHIFGLITKKLKGFNQNHASTPVGENECYSTTLHGLTERLKWSIWRVDSCRITLNSAKALGNRPIRF